MTPGHHDPENATIFDEPKKVVAFLGLGNLLNHQQQQAVADESSSMGVVALGCCAACAVVMGLGYIMYISWGC
jgi:hypothetical protein